MIAEILNTDRKSKRIKIKIPFAAKAWRNDLKKMQGIWYHQNQKLWSVPNKKQNLQHLYSLFGKQNIIHITTDKISEPMFEMCEIVAQRIENTETKMVLSGLSS